MCDQAIRCGDFSGHKGSFLFCHQADGGRRSNRHGGALEIVLQKMGLPEATGSDLTGKHIAAMLSHTWFAVPIAHALQAPLTGSRPGDSDADVLFTYVLTKVFKVILVPKSKAFLSHTTPGMGRSNIATWVDDVALAIAGRAEDLTAQVLLAIVHDAMLEQGKDAGARQNMENTSPKGIPLISEFKGCTRFPLVSHYKHLALDFLSYACALQQQWQS